MHAPPSDLATLAPMERPFTVDEYHTLAVAGILDEDSRTELIDGRIIVVSPIGSRHLNVVVNLTEVFARLVFKDDATLARLSIQNPLRLDDLTEPEPDLVLLHPDTPRDRTPTPADALLVVEVADATVAYDRRVKAPRYARAAVRELWIVLLEEEAVEVYRLPGPDGYASVRRLGPDAPLAVEALPDLPSIPTRRILHP